MQERIRLCRGAKKIVVQKFGKESIQAIRHGGHVRRRRERQLGPDVVQHGVDAGHRGTPWIEQQHNFSGAYNCTSTNLVDWEAFGLMMDLAMMGCGTGAIIEPYLIGQLPAVRNQLSITGVSDIGATPAGQRQLQAGLASLLPVASAWPPMERWWGFRPHTPDEAPLLGTSPIPGLWLAAGHHRNGVLLAAITAELVSGAILGDLGAAEQSQLNNFSWRRFERT